MFIGKLDFDNGESGDEFIQWSISYIAGTTPYPKSHNFSHCFISYVDNGSSCDDEIDFRVDIQDYRTVGNKLTDRLQEYIYDTLKEQDKTDEEIQEYLEEFGL